MLLLQALGLDQFRKASGIGQDLGQLRWFKGEQLIAISDAAVMELLLNPLFKLVRSAAAKVARPDNAVLVSTAMLIEAAGEIARDAELVDASSELAFKDVVDGSMRSLHLLSSLVKRVCLAS